MLEWWHRESAALIVITIDATFSSARFAFTLRYYRSSAVFVAEQLRPRHYRRREPEDCASSDHAAGPLPSRASNTLPRACRIRCSLKARMRLV
ncbi:protein of unknown function (plasmid) [Caballeronia sp. S22]